MDTGTIVAAIRSPTGASAALLMAARRGLITLVATVSLCVEYDGVCSRADHVGGAQFGPADPP
jgi:hypothetical protein